MHINQIKSIFGDSFFSESELVLLTESKTGQTAEISQSAVMASLINSKATQGLSLAMIDLRKTNEHLATSNDRNAKAMIYLTIGLVIAAFLQMIVSLVDIFVS